MKKVLALASILCSPMAFGVAVPNVLGILLALLQLGSNIGFATLVSVFASLIFFPGGIFLPSDFVFLL
ncbi:MAG: hypothetical protein HY314_13125 [Acidobacteria bacterium]|nr:hypothetical protein [Acidobacteriota bacterium]